MSLHAAEDTTRRSRASRARSAGRRGALLLGLALAPAWAAAQQPQKLGFVDSNKIIEATPGVSEAKANYEKQAEAWRAELVSKQKELNDLQEEYKKQVAILSPDKKTEKEQAILAKQKEAQDYFQAKFGPQGEASVKEKELLRPIYDRINKAIEEVRADEGYALIFDVQAGALAAGDPSLDLTDKVVAKLKSEGATVSATPAPAPAAAEANPSPPAQGAAQQ
ncbi:MAG TPA: OmpH family outer membrane protein [Gemmatimonadota bacterium]|jgi:outer membrane protein